MNFNETCLQTGQEMTGNVPETFLDQIERILMVLQRIPQIPGPSTGGRGSKNFLQLAGQTPHISLLVLLVY